MNSHKYSMKILLSIALVGLTLNNSFILVSGNPLSSTATIIQPIIIIGSTQGSQPGQFNEPDGVAVSTDGTIFAGDTYNLRIQVFDKNGTYLRNITGFTEVPNNEVQGIAINSLGELCVVDMFGHKVRIFDPNGTQVSELGSQGSGLGGFQEPQGIAVDSENRIFIVDTNRNTVLLFDRNGTFITEFGSSYLGAPESILIDEPNSRILVCSEEASKVVVFDYTDFTKITEFGKSGLGSITDDPEGIALDSDGNIIVNDEGAGRMSVFFPNLTYFHSFGGGTGSASGYFNSPDGITFDHVNQRLIVADQGNYRLQVFNWTEVMQELNSLPVETIPSTTTTTTTTTAKSSPGFVLAPVIVAMALLTLLARKTRKKRG